MWKNVSNNFLLKEKTKKKKWSVVSKDTFIKNIKLQEKLTAQLGKLAVKEARSYCCINAYMLTN